MISIIIVNFNTGNILKECISSLFANEKGDYEIIAVDNNSTDNSKEIINSLEKQYGIKKLFLPADEGFAYANNRGFEMSAGEYILIMNPDIIFTEPVLEILLNDFKKDVKLGAVTPLLLGTDRKFQRNYFQRYPSLLQYFFFHSVFAKFFFKFPSLMNRYLEDQEIEKKDARMVKVAQIPFAFFFTTRKIFEEAGRMDEKYKLFFEDVDMSYQINKSQELQVDKSISITHLGGSSFKTKDNWRLYGRYMMSMNYFFDKNYFFLRSFILKILCISNSSLILLIENIKKIFGKPDEYRYKKHSYFLGELFKHHQ